MALIVFILAASVASAQTTIQAKPVFHSSIPTEPKLYPAWWSITNIREDASDNTNIMFGIGRKTGKGWLEVMGMRQYSTQKHQWFVDIRWQRSWPNKFSTLVEVSPFVGRKALYTFARLEHPIYNRINVVVETENVHQVGTDSISFGPGIGLRPMPLFKRVRFAPVAAWHFKPKEGSNFVRFYMAFPF